jgi:DNA repair protein RecO (recombination protein O)
MEWRDDGLIIGARKHGETGVVVELMTARHGRHLGLVRGGRSRRMRPVLQAGNSVEATWRARLDEHLGSFSVEGTSLRAADVMGSGQALDAVHLTGALLRLLPERDPHPMLYEAALVIADNATRPGIAPALLVRFELGILSELGFGLDLSLCAATGASVELIYVSPKSGRAVSRAAGEPYRDRLLALPPFLSGGPDTIPSVQDVLEGFLLTSHFLMRDVFGPRGLPMPPSRNAYVERLTRDLSEIDVRAIG